MCNSSNSTLLCALFMALLLATAGCSSEAPEAVPIVELAEALAFEPIGRGQQARLDTTAEVAIRDASLWAAYQDSLRALQPFEAVDFTQEMVLLAALHVPSGGYSINFESVEKTSDGLTVHYLLSTPGYDCMTTMGDAVVFHAVRVARTEGPVRFEHEEEAYPCTERR